MKSGPQPGRESVVARLIEGAAALQSSLLEDRLWVSVKDQMPQVEGQYLVIRQGSVSHEGDPDMPDDIGGPETVPHYVCTSNWGRLPPYQLPVGADPKVPVWHHGGAPEDAGDCPDDILAWYGPISAPPMPPWVEAVPLLDIT